MDSASPSCSAPARLDGQQHAPTPIVSARSGWPSLGDDQGHAVWTVDQPDEQLVDLAWAPDSRHLLVVGRQQPSLGMERTSLRWLDTTTGTAQLLALLPSEVVPGSYVWRPDGHALAFLVHTASLSAVCTLSDTGEFHYLGDLGHDGTAGPPVAPVAWGPDGQLVYAALKPARRQPLPIRWDSVHPRRSVSSLADPNGGPGRSFGTSGGPLPDLVARRSAPAGRPAG